ncbi:MAG: TetR/AcrR family transcriptional regulator [Acidimicrobiia bacterium]|nr:TetR/AcrR family transcriptional regulator [Acidimicrobiia bacterium]
MRGDDRRRQLIDAALHVFATRGFPGATTRAIAEAAGVSEAIIFRHFASKEDLYAAILEQKGAETGLADAIEGFRQRAAACDDEGLFRDLAAKILDSYRTDPDFRRLLLYASLEGHTIARVAQQTLELPMFGFLRDYVARRQRAGVFRRGDPGLMVFALVAMPVYYSIITRLVGVDPTGKADDEVARTFARLFLDGLRAPERQPPTTRQRRTRT